MNTSAYAGLEQALSQLVRIPTVCRTERYEIAAYRQKLKELFPEVFSRAQARPIGEALLLRFPGGEPSLPPVLFTGHMDVVDATPDGWTFPPFSGTIDGDRVWGRGSVDMKGAQCALLAALSRLLGAGYQPRRTLWLYLSCDEEIGGETTTKAAEWLQRQGVRFDAVFDEGGSLSEDFWGKIPGRSAMIGIAEKGSLEYRFTARAAGGHAANPPRNSAIVRLCALVSELENHPPFRRGLTPDTARMLRGMAAYFAPDERDALLRALDAADETALTRALPEQADLLLGATIAFTRLQAGTAFNVMPKQAVLTANVRPSAVQGQAEITELLRRKAAEYDVECELAAGGDATPFSDVNSFGFQAVRQTARKLLGDIPVAPFLLTGGTDSRHFLGIADHAVRFSPIYVGPEEGRGVHGVNEYLTVDSLKNAACFYESLLRDCI